MAETPTKEQPEAATVTATVRGIPFKVLERVKQLAYEAGVIPDVDKSTSDAIRWALVQAYSDSPPAVK